MTLALEGIAAQTGKLAGSEFARLVGGVCFAGENESGRAARDR